MRRDACSATGWGFQLAHQQAVRALAPLNSYMALMTKEYRITTGRSLSIEVDTMRCSSTSQHSKRVSLNILVRNKFDVHVSSAASTWLVLLFGPHQVFRPPRRRTWVMWSGLGFSSARCETDVDHQYSDVMAPCRQGGSPHYQLC